MIINKNFVHSLSCNSKESKILGIQLNGKPANVINNMVRLGIDAMGNNVEDPKQIFGITNNSENDNNIWHNSIYIGGVGVDGSKSAAYHNFGLGMDNLTNNIFANQRETAGKNYALYLLYPTSVESDYNIFELGGNSILGNVDGLELNSIREFRVFLPLINGKHQNLAAFANSD